MSAVECSRTITVNQSTSAAVVGGSALSGIAAPSLMSAVAGVSAMLTY